MTSQMASRASNRRAVARTLAYLLLVLLCFWTSSVSADIVQGYIEEDYITCIQLESLRVSNLLGTSFSEEVMDWYCIQKLRWKLARSRVSIADLTDDQRDWLNSIFSDVVTVSSRVNDADLIRDRKEYRLLTADELFRFNTALTALKEDPIGKFDALVTLYTAEDSAGAAHYGPQFLPWNRLFLLIVEQALREYDNTTSLPYWDCTMDAGLTDPTNSILWSSRFLGNGKGVVRTGPFSGWRNANGLPIIRNVGEGGRLITREDLSHLFSQSSMSAITFPNADSKNNIEFLHGAVHMWVGGDMADLSHSLYDPVFLLLATFIDSLWEEYRGIQQSQNVNPSTDWPANVNGDVYQAPASTIRILPRVTNLGSLSNRYGSNIYKYASRPACSDPGCGSRYLRCSRSLAACVPYMSSETLSSPYGLDGYQNQYCIDGQCDESNWVFIPIRIIYNRPPDFKKYGSYPIMNNVLDYSADIYSPAVVASEGAYGTIYSDMRQNDAYNQCQDNKGRLTKGRVYVSTYGLNYNGIWREFSTVDRRLPLSASTAYSAVMRPTDNLTPRVMVRATDECGRMCEAMCSGQSCSGVLELTETNGRTRGFYDSMSEAIYSQWQFPNPNYGGYPLPSRDVNDEPYLTFHCDYTGLWPWVEFSFEPEPNRPSDPIQTIYLHGTLWQFQITAPTNNADLIEDPFGDFDGDTAPPVPTTTPTTTETTTTEPTTVLTTLAPTTPGIQPLWECWVLGWCYKDYNKPGCKNCTHAEFLQCPRTCDKYLYCSEGMWHVMNCYPGLKFNLEVQTCAWSWQSDDKCKGKPFKPNELPGRPTAAPTADPNTEDSYDSGFFD